MTNTRFTAVRAQVPATKAGYQLFIDDERYPADDGRQWVIARTSGEAIRLFQERGLPAYISFDHDLGGPDTAMVFVNHIIDSALDLLALGADPRTIAFPRKFYVHSRNFEGAKNIEAKMNNFIEHLDKLQAEFVPTHK